MEHLFWGNTPGQWLTAAAFVAGGFIAGKICSILCFGILRRLSQKSKNKVDDVLVEAAGRPLTILVFAAGIALGCRSLSLSEPVQRWTDRLLPALFIAVIAWGVSRIIKRTMAEYIAAGNFGGNKETEALAVLRKLTGALVWIIAGVFILRTLGYDIGALLAGLGLGGAALALASRDTLANFFGAITVFVDRPFRLNERIKIAGYDGHIIEMGLRTSRLRTLEDRAVIIPNSMFTAAPIENVSLEPHTRVSQTITLRRDNGLEKLALGVSLLRDICSGVTGAGESSQAGIVSIGGAACQITFVYYVSKDADYLSVVNQVNLEALRRFEEAGIVMG